jgi:hypothetical protein
MIDDDKKENNNKFNFVNDLTKEPDDYLEEDTTSEPLVKPKQEKKQLPKNIKLLILIGCLVLFSAGLFFFGLFWQAKYDLLAICNSFWLAFTLNFFIFWIIFIHNKNVLSPIVYGTKSFALMIVGKRSKTSYYEYLKKIQDNPIPGKYVLIPLFSSLALLIPAIITMIIVM